MSDGLTSMLKKLRLSGLNDSLEIRLHEASSRGLTHRELLELALQDELLVRDGRQISRRIAAACFRDVKRLEDFDFSFNSTIKKNRIFDLATGHFIRDKRDVLWLGPPGTGKSHLCQAIGVAAIRSGFTVYYRSIFDTVRDFLHDEAMEGHERILQRYLKPDLRDRTRTPFPATVVVKLDCSGIGGAQIWFEWPLDGEVRECFWPVMSD